MGNAVVSQEQWLVQRKKLLAQEKEFMQRRDELSKARRQLPWVSIAKDYRFEDADGKYTLADLFGSRSQLIIYHFMFGENWDEGCPSCSLWSDGINGSTVHFGARDARFVVVSTASHPKLTAYKKRMNWEFDWVSCAGSDFNRDFHVSFVPEESDPGEVTYNYRALTTISEELPGVSVFVKNSSNEIFHTYSTYSRGLYNLNVVYQYLDLLPGGRGNETELPFTMAWVKRHDQYQ